MPGRGNSSSKAWRYEQAYFPQPDPKEGILTSRIKSENESQMPEATKMYQELRCKTKQGKEESIGC